MGFSVCRCHLPGLRGPAPRRKKHRAKPATTTLFLPTSVLLSTRPAHGDDRRRGDRLLSALLDAATES